MRFLLSALLLTGFFCRTASAQNHPYLPKADPAQTPQDLRFQQACAKGDLKEATDLLNQGVNIETRDLWGTTALMFAADNNFQDVVNFLLQKGANINAQDHTGSTALELACTEPSTHDIAMTLLDKGADPNLVNQTGMTEWPLGSVAIYGDSDMKLLSALLDHKADINHTSWNGTALSQAIMRGQWDTFDLLISKGADPNIPDSWHAWGRTPLIEVTKNGWNSQADTLRKIHLLLKAGANPNFKSKSGLTALMYAAQLSLMEPAQALVAAGTDINVTDDRGETALTIAGDRGHQDMVAFLKSKGATRLDLHIIAHEKPILPLTPAHAWMLALGAMYNQRDGTNPNFLGGKVEQTKYEVQSDLLLRWDIRDIDDFLEKLDDLTAAGDRTKIQTSGAKLAAMSDAEFATFLLPLASNSKVVAQARLARQNALKWKDKNDLGLDLSTVVHLVNSGYAAGYIDDTDAWHLMLPVARLAQKNFGSWAEFGQNFLDSRELSVGARDPTIEACVQLLANPKDPNSPWNQCPWNTDLSANE